MTFQFQENGVTRKLICAWLNPADMERAWIDYFLMSVSVTPDGQDHHVITISMTVLRSHARMMEIVWTLLTTMNANVNQVTQERTVR